MGQKDPRVDEYIARAAPFARPILKHLRKVVHAGCPEVQETIKWSFPHFEHRGILAGMAAFKEHCSFGFWKRSLIFPQSQDEERDGMGHFGRITSLADLPAEKTLLGYVRKAAQLNETGTKEPKTLAPKKDSASLQVPPDLAAGLKKNAKARKTFAGFSYSNRKDYIEWLTEAKRTETRAKRLATTLEWLAEGKTRNWKYERC